MEKKDIDARAKVTFVTLPPLAEPFPIFSFLFFFFTLFFPSSKSCPSSLLVSDWMSEATAPLLGRTSTDTADDETTYKEAPSLARFLGALSQGKLPDNGQLFTILHKAASFLDGISSSIAGSIESNGYHDDGDDGDGVFSDDTAMILGNLLKESGALSRLLARWIYGEEAKEEQKRLEGEKQGARGNENEQIQRLLWHLAQAFSFDTSLPVDVDIDIPVDVKKAKENVEEGAKQVKEDSVASGKSIARLVSLVLSSEE